jgi:A/G-specific adenine glycosylase
VDGNVFRILARFFGEAIAIDSVKGKVLFTDLANKLLFKEDSAAYNQALMDFGATICKPQLPDCFNCVLKKECVAYNSGLVSDLPVKEKRLIKRKRFFTYFIFLTDEGVLLRKRIEKDIWENLYEFYLYESSKELHWKQKDIKQWLGDQLAITDFSIIKISDPYTQQLTHQTLSGRFITITLPVVPASLQHFLEQNVGQLSLVAFPKFINQYLQDQPFISGTIEKILV